MKQKAKVALLVALLMITGATVAAAAANPIPSATAPSPGSASAAAPTDYLQAIKLLQDNKYGENEIKSFVYQVFSLFDRHAEVNNLLLLFANEDLYMKVPEGRIDSHQDFEKWYAGIGAKYQSNIHRVERVDVQIPAKGDYRVNVLVLWQALDREGKLTSLRTRQEWKIIDGGGYWPRIVSYIAEPAP
jgi:hypothetical protein